MVGSTTDGAVMARRSTALCLLQVYAWLVILLPSNLVIGPLGAFGAPSSLVGLMAFGLWAVAACQPRFLVRKVVAVRVAVLALWIPGLISYAVMQLHASPVDEVNAADRWILFGLVWSGVALLAAEGLRDDTEVMRLLRVIVAGAALTSAVAIAQSQLGYDATTWIAKLPGLAVNGDLQSVLTRAGRARPSGTALHPLELGTTLAISLGLAIALATLDQGWSRARKFVAVSVIALGIPLSISRSAVVSALIVGFFWFAAASPRSRIHGAFVAMGFGGVIFVLSPGLLGVFRGLFMSVGSDSSVSMRTDDYSAISGFLRQSPWIGRGPGTFLPKFRVLDNQWLLTLVDRGILGALGMALYFLVVGYLGRSIRRESVDPLHRALGQALVGVSVVVMWAASTFDFFSFPMTGAYIAMVLGLAGALRGVAGRREVSRSAAVEFAT